MLDFPRWKRLSISIMLALGVLLAIPSLIGETNAKRVGLGFLPRISLGLDLSGGSHLLLEADTADVTRTRLAAMEDTILSQMARDPAIDIGDVSTSNGALTFFVRNAAQVDAAVDKARAQTSGVGNTGQRDWDVSVVDGNRIVMTPTKAGIDNFIAEAMNGATDVVRKRIDALGTREPTIVRQGSDRILVEVPGFQNPAALKALIGRTAKLEFKMVSDAAPVLGRAPIGTQLLQRQGGGQVLVQRRVIINGAQLTKAKQGYDQNNQPAVDITFNAEGGRRFAEVTQQNSGKRFAIILDNVVISDPNINEPILGGAAIIMGNFTSEKLIFN